MITTSLQEAQPKVMTRKILMKSKEDLVLDDADTIIPLALAAIILAIDSLKDSIDTNALEWLLSEGEQEKAESVIGAISFDNLLFGIGVATASSFVDEIYSAFSTGGRTAMAELLPAIQKELVFDVLNTRAVGTIRRQATIAAEAVTKTVMEGVSQLVSGKVGIFDDIKAHAKFIVDSIGLTPSQAIAVSNYRKQLESRKLLGFTNPLDRKVDVLDFSLIQQQMTVGNLSQANIDRLVSNYSKKLLEKHALDIARTEILNAINTGRQELWEQAIDQGIFDDSVHKYWRVTPDDRLRATHAAIPVMNPVGVPIRSQFITPFGNVYGPQDRRVELINCRCVLVLDASVSI